MKQGAFFIFVTLAICNASYGQKCYGENLIPNAGLDTITTCPWNMWQIEYAYPWTQPLTISGSTALHQCMFADPNTQHDTAYWNAFKHWRSLGMAYLIVWDKTNWRVYIETKLKHPLEAGKCYYAEFYALTHNVSYKVIDALGIYFSDTLVKTHHDTIIGGDTISFIVPIYTTPQIYNPGVIIKDTANWTKISGTFTATGTETAMIVGNFIPNDQIQWEILNDWDLQSSRYFFDDFLVCACEDTIPPEGKVYIPNIFSPNGDGNNDLFLVRGEQVSQVDLKIFNRWGNLVFETQELLSGWDGRCNGKECPEGVYFYSASITYVSGKIEAKKGNVTLVK
jgi:gliding motility-associated-like protein